jgi:hypothetical protein
MNGKRIHYLCPSPVAGHIPAIVDKLLDIDGIKPQGTSPGSHLDGRKIRPTLARCVLNHPRNTDSQLLRYIPGPNQLPDGADIVHYGRQGTSVTASIQLLHPASLAHAFYLRHQQDSVKCSREHEGGPPMGRSV